MTEQQHGHWCFFDEKGEIKVRGYMSSQEAAVNAGQYGLSYLYAIGDEATQYVLNGTLTERPSLSVTLTGSSLVGVPAGASVNIEGTEYPADGSNIELTFSHVGTYKIAISMFPYADMELTYENQTPS